MAKLKLNKSSTSRLVQTFFKMVSERKYVDADSLAAYCLREGVPMSEACAQFGAIFHMANTQNILRKTDKYSLSERSSRAIPRYKVIRTE